MIKLKSVYEKIHDNAWHPAFRAQFTLSDAKRNIITDKLWLIIEKQVSDNIWTAITKVVWKDENSSY